MLKPGKYVARIVDYYVQMSKNEVPFPRIEFEVDLPDGITETVSWNGSFKEGKAREIAMETILICGFSGQNLTDFAKGPSSNLIPADHEVRITVDTESYLDEKNESKTVAKVQWVNPLHGGKFRKAMPVSDFAYCVNAMGLNASFKSLAAQIQQKQETKVEVPF